MEELSDDQRRRKTLAQVSPDFSVDRAYAQAKRRFSMKMLWPECRQTTVRLMLMAATSARVFGNPKDRYRQLADQVLVKKGREKELDLSKEVVLGYDDLWGCGFAGWRSLVVVVPSTHSLIVPILGGCYGPEYYTDWRGGFGTKAAEHAFTSTESGESIAFCLGGIELAEVVASPEQIGRLFDFVARHCRLSRPERY